MHQILLYVCVYIRTFLSSPLPPASVGFSYVCLHVISILLDAVNSCFIDLYCCCSRCSCCCCCCTSCVWHLIKFEVFFFFVFSVAAAAVAAELHFNWNSCCCCCCYQTACCCWCWCCCCLIMRRENAIHVQAIVQIFDTRRFVVVVVVVATCNNLKWNWKSKKNKNENVQQLFKQNYVHLGWSIFNVNICKLLLLLLMLWSWKCSS